MDGMKEIVEELRTAQGNDSGRENSRNPAQRSNTKRKRSRKRRDSGGSASRSSTDSSSSGDTTEEKQEESEGMKPSVQEPVDAKKQDTLSDKEDHKARFYANYCKLAKDYDKEFLKTCGGDLDTTLIFAGLFSAVASAFIILVDSQLQPDSGDKTAALLRVLIYKIDDTTFGNDVPALPQWTGPPPTMVQIQAILFASLAASLLSAFLAMLGKQWLNRYSSTNVRGSAVDRSQNRQRKLDGIDRWYFDSVMESLPIMLQVALLLLGRALSRYLWEISRTVAWVVIGVTSFGLLFYLFIIVVGSVWESCPYQTPGSFVLRYLALKIPKKIHSAAANALHASEVIQNLTNVWNNTSFAIFFGLLVVVAPVWFVSDFFRLGRAAVGKLKALSIGAYRLLRRIYVSFRLSLTQGFNQQTAKLDLRCILWTLQISLEPLVRTSTLKYLITIPESTDFDNRLVEDCFHIFVGYISIINNKVVVAQGLEELATYSARCFFQTFRRVSPTNPTPDYLGDLRQLYVDKFPREIDFRGVPFYLTMANFHALINPDWSPSYVVWTDYRPTDQELIPFARQMVEVARVERRRTETRKVPCWILRFVLRVLSCDPPSPSSAIVDCLTILVIALSDDDHSNIQILGESLRMEPLSNVIIQKLEIIAGAPSQDPIFRSKRKAISSLFPYAVRLAKGGQQRMVDGILRVSLRSTSGGFMWARISPWIASLFDKSTPPSLNQAIALVSPCADWTPEKYTGIAVARWATAALETPYSDQVGQSAVDALLQIARSPPLRQHLPTEIWALLKRGTPLPPVCQGRKDGTALDVVRHIRGLGDVEILKSHFLLVWSEWDPGFDDGITEMEIAIVEEFGGIAMQYHREDLAKRLDHIQGQLDRGFEYLKQHQPEVFEYDVVRMRQQYGRLKEVLVEVDRRITEALPES